MQADPLHTPTRIDLARGLLREAVFQSRAKQAAGTSLLRAAATPDAKNCGLGAHAAVESRLSERGRELVAQLWPSGLAPLTAERAESLLTTWVERQNAVDRKRNHFLRDFRAANGFDRTRYTSEQLAALEAGLARINEDEDRQRDSAAAELSRIG